MTFENSIFASNINFPIVLASNSSWYLRNYRSSLIKNLINKNQHVIAVAPIDKSSLELSKLLPHIPWEINRKSIFNPLKFTLYFFKMLMIIKVLKPKLIHSHTLSSNLICSLVSLILDIPCALSFAGLGTLYRGKGFSKIILNLILRIIAQASSSNTLFWGNKRKDHKRSILIFQNIKDQNYFINRFNKFPRDQISMIPGSGVPNKYLKYNIQGNLYWSKDENKSLENKLELIYCGRLLASKGINTFLNIAKTFKENKFLVYGGIDLSQKDSLDLKKISLLKKQNPNVKFFGNIEEPFFRNDFKFPILIVPSNYGEGLPRAIIEAIALGIPVICSKNSTSGIFNENHVYISKGDNTSYYEECIEQIINEYKSGKLLIKIKFAHEYVLKNYTEEFIVKQTIKAYEKIDFKYSESNLMKMYKKKITSWIAD